MIHRWLEQGHASKAYELAVVMVEAGLGGREPVGYASDLKIWRELRKLTTCFERRTSTHSSVDSHTSRYNVSAALASSLTSS